MWARSQASAEGISKTPLLSFRSSARGPSETPPCGNACSDLVNERGRREVRVCVCAQEVRRAQEGCLVRGESRRGLPRLWRTAPYLLPFPRVLLRALSPPHSGAASGSGCPALEGCSSPSPGQPEPEAPPGCAEEGANSRLQISLRPSAAALGPQGTPESRGGQRPRGWRRNPAAQLCGHRAPRVPVALGVSSAARRSRTAGAVRPSSEG